jgi:hypothetical protein
MLYSEIIAVCSEIRTKHINALCGQNAEFFNVRPDGAYSNHWAFESCGESVLYNRTWVGYIAVLKETANELICLGHLLIDC